MTYEEALGYITSRGRFGIKLGTERVAALLAELGNPQTGVRGALVAGTNGKGSTCAFLASILQAAGLRTGLMPKPHLVSYTERVQLDSEPITEADFATALAQIAPAVERVAARLGDPTEFEILTALAVNHLAPRIDRLVCEVGMGGRLDATNVLDLGVAVITNVSLDHQQHLGGTVEAIAAEKAAIVKPGNTVITGADGVALRVVEQAAGGAELWRLGRELSFTSTSLGWDGSRVDVSGPGFKHSRVHVPLIGEYQAANAALAVAAAHATAAPSPEAVERGVAATLWPGRFEVVASRPRVVLDGGHNVEGLRSAIRELRQLVSDERVVVVFGAMRDKDIDGLLSELRRLEPARVVFTRVAYERAADPADLLSRWNGPGEASADPASALQIARDAAGEDGSVLVCGSLYLVGALRTAFARVAA